MNEHALALRAEPAMPDVVQLGQLMSASGFFQDTKDAAQAVVKILAGKEIGVGPVAAMTGIHIVQGRVTMSANLIGAAIKRSGRYTYRVRELTAQVCRLEFFEAGESIGVTDFAWADAERAQLAGKAIWKQYPRNMLFARAMSNGARFFCPDVFGGPIYTPEELGATVRVADDGAVEVASVPPVTEAPLPADAASGRAEPDPSKANERARAIAAAMDAAVAEADAGIEPVTDETRIACAAFVDAVQAANPKVRPKLPPDDAGDAVWRAWRARKSAEWATSPHNPAAAAAV